MKETPEPRRARSALSSSKSAVVVKLDSCSFRFTSAHLAETSAAEATVVEEAKVEQNHTSEISCIEECWIAASLLMADRTCDITILLSKA